MLKKPIQKQEIIELLQAHYGLDIQIADVSTHFSHTFILSTTKDATL